VSAAAPRPSQAPASIGRLAEMSLSGLQHAQALQPASVEATAARLYAWNRLPSSAWRRLTAEPARIGTKAARAAGKRWLQIEAGPPASRWCRWRPIDAPAMPQGPLWKAYVSPRPHDLADAVCAALSACAGLPVLSLKYGADEDGMLRPDKLVVYLATREAVDALGDRLAGLLAGCPAHGVPYSAELGGDGLVSWGCDPPIGSAAAGLGPSWRSWVTRRLAQELARDGVAGIEPWQRALDAVARAGVDPVTWAPAPDLWTTKEAG
jgi:hypothetical protein